MLLNIISSDLLTKTGTIQEKLFISSYCRQLSTDSKMKNGITIKLFILLTVENCKKYDTIMIFSIVENRFNPADLKRFRSLTKKNTCCIFWL